MRDGRRRPPKGQNSQAEGPFSDRPLESVESHTTMTMDTTDEAIRPAGGIDRMYAVKYRTDRRIFQVKRQSEAFVLI